MDSSWSIIAEKVWEILCFSSLSWLYLLTKTGDPLYDYIWLGELKQLMKKYCNQQLGKYFCFVNMENCEAIWVKEFWWCRCDIYLSHIFNSFELIWNIEVDGDIKFSSNQSSKSNCDFDWRLLRNNKIWNEMWKKSKRINNVLELLILKIFLYRELQRRIQPQ